MSNGISFTCGNKENSQPLIEQIAELKHQLAEKDAELKKWSTQYARAYVNRQNALIAEKVELQHQLADKEKEIEKLTEELDDKNFCKDFVDLYTENKLKTQMLHENWKDKISFCIEQLDKVKELCREKFNWWENSEWEGDIYDKADVSNAYFDIEANIEEKIKQLKEMCKND